MSRTAIFALACCTFFCIAGMVFAPLLGIENDEALFAGAIWAPPGHGVPLMLMTYLGALKGWLYAPLFHLWTPTPYSIRMPAVFMGAAAIGLFFLLLRRMAGERAAVIGTLLLATDSLFLLTTVYDWGPVAMQHLLTAGALLAMVRFLDRHRTLDLALAFFLVGLALWDKTISIWIFSAIAIATLAVYPREFARLCTVRRALVAGASLIAGASPLILYNLNSGFLTLHQDSGFAPQEIPAKFRFLVDSLHGGLFGWMTLTERPWPVANLLGILFVASIALWPLVWKRNAQAARIMAFVLVFLVAGWLAMAVTRYAGTGVHHTTLLWPFPQMFVGLALGQVWHRNVRMLCAAVIAIVTAHNIFVLQAYRQDIRQRGSPVVWTDGIYPLAKFSQPLPTQYFVLDWGILENLVLLREGKLSLHAAWDPLKRPLLSEVEKNMVRGWVSGPSNVFLSHVRSSETFPGCRENLDAIAHEMGLREVMVASISDSHGKRVFEAFRFAGQY